MELSDPVIPIPSAVRIAGVEERQITIDDVSWRYLLAGSHSSASIIGVPGTPGSAPALILVHGLMGFSWSWRFNMQALGQHFTVYAPDLPGCGFSQRADCLPGSLEADAEALLKFADHLGIEQFDLLGTSRGGGITVMLASLLAQHGMQCRIRRMILSAPINPWSQFGQMRARMIATEFGRLWAIHCAPRMPFLIEKYFRKLYADVSRIAPGSVEGYRAGLTPPGTFKYIARMMRVWHRDLKQIETALPLIGDLPILLLWGDRDNAVAPSTAYELHKRLKNSAVLMMKGVGHLPYEESPEDFNRIVCDFFLRHCPRTPLEIANSAPKPVASSRTSIQAEIQPSNIAR